MITKSGDSYEELIKQNIKTAEVQNVLHIGILTSFVKYCLGILTYENKLIIFVWFSEYSLEQYYLQMKIYGTLDIVLTWSFNLSVEVFE